jgi:hypothetical protein
MTDDSRLILGPITKTVDLDHYVVQAIWPNSEKELEDLRWGAYFPGAYDDLDHRSPGPNSRGTFDQVNADVATAPSRVVGGGDRAPTFTDPRAALDYAARLRDRGRLVCSQGSEPWRKFREGPIQTRVVRDRLAHVVQVVEGIR